MGSRSEKPTWRTLAAVVVGAAFVSVFAPPPVGPGPAYADECSDLRAAIQQLDSEIASMGSAGRTGGGSGGQVGAYQDARNNYVNAYNSMNCANGGLQRGGGSSGGYSAPRVDPGMSALVLGAGILDSMINADRERSRQAAIDAEARRQAEYQRQQAERQSQEAERLLAAQRAREADTRMRMATANAFGPAGSGQTGANPFATPFVQSSGGTLAAPNEGAVNDALSRPVMQDLHARGVTGCPSGQPLANYCSIEPDWWRHEQAGRTYSPSACVTYVQAVTNDTPQCNLRYRATLARSQAEVRNQASEIQHQQRCTANPFLEECQDN